MGVQRYADPASLHTQIDHIFGYHRPKYQETMDEMGLIREAFKSVGHLLVDHCPPSVDLYQAIDDLDDACKHAIAALARYEPKGQRTNVTSHPQEAGPDDKHQALADLFFLLDEQPTGVFNREGELNAVVSHAKEVFGFSTEEIPGTGGEPSFVEQYPKDAFAPQAFEGAVKKVKDSPQA
jgi:hypothetical protein